VHVAPFVPHALDVSDASARQLPEIPPLQQPPAHVFALHAHVPFVLSQRPLPHAAHVAPAAPHEAPDSEAYSWHVPPGPPLQHPFGQEVALHTQLPVPASHVCPWPHVTFVHADGLVPGWQV
jgi:hypothetical protein